MKGVALGCYVAVVVGIVAVVDGGFVVVGVVVPLAGGAVVVGVVVVVAGGAVVVGVVVVVEDIGGVSDICSWSGTLLYYIFCRCNLLCLTYIQTPCGHCVRTASTQNFLVFP